MGKKKDRAKAEGKAKRLVKAAASVKRSAKSDAVTTAAGNLDDENGVKNARVETAVKNARVSNGIEGAQAAGVSNGDVPARAGDPWSGSATAQADDASNGGKASKDGKASKSGKVPNSAKSIEAVKTSSSKKTAAVAKHVAKAVAKKAAKAGGKAAKAGLKKAAQAGGKTAHAGLKKARALAKKPAANKLAKRFRALERELWSAEYAMEILEFDGATVAPEKGAAGRGEALGYLSGQHHALISSSHAQKLVRKLENAVIDGSLTDEQLVAEARVFARDQREAAAIPEKEAVAYTKLICEADAVWHKAKLANDWASFEPFVDRIVEALKRQASYLDPSRDPYDVLLDQYERGLTSASFDLFCAQVRGTVVPLVRRISEKGEQPAAEFRSARVPGQIQRELSFDLMRLVGLDMSAACLAFTEHPFSEGFAQGDARVATHIYEDDALSNVYSMIHESGHAIYEQNVNPAYSYTCLEGGTSMGIHESQSRFFENTVGRSRAFMGPLLKLLRARIPDVYAGVSEDELYRAVNIARPSLIRTEADELTYPLHIMIRYEVERALFSGEASAKDIPALWNQLTQRYLGISVPNDREGCLQDTHWSGGSFGYFPTYALGSAYDAQYVPAMEADGVDLHSACASGDLAPVRDWLREKIWRWGRAKDADELIRGACGAPFDATYYCEYLQKKFSELYGL